MVKLMMKKKGSLAALLLASALATNCRQQPAPVNPEAAALIKRELREGFGTHYVTSWYPAILDVSVRGDRVLVRTSLPSKGEMASNICAAVSGIINANDNPFGSQLDTVEITNADNTRTFILVFHELGNKCE